MKAKRGTVTFMTQDGESVEAFLFRREADLFVRFQGTEKAATMRLTPHVLELICRKLERKVIA